VLIRVGEYPLNGSVKSRKVFVPAASFSNRGEAYSVHQKPFLAVSDSHLRQNGSPLSDQLVFLSRSKFRGRRDIRNQVELESALAEKVPIPGQRQVWTGLKLAIDVEQTLRYFEAVV